MIVTSSSDEDPEGYPSKEARSKYIQFAQKQYKEKKAKKQNKAELQRLKSQQTKKLFTEGISKIMIRKKKSDIVETFLSTAKRNQEQRKVEESLLEDRNLGSKHYRSVGTNTPICKFEPKKNSIIKNKIQDKSMQPPNVGPPIPLVKSKSPTLVTSFYSKFENSKDYKFTDDLPEYHLKIREKTKKDIEHYTNLKFELEEKRKTVNIIEDEPVTSDGLGKSKSKENNEKKAQALKLVGKLADLKMEKSNLEASTTKNSKSPTKNSIRPPIKKCDTNITNSNERDVGSIFVESVSKVIKMQKIINTMQEFSLFAK